MSLSDDQIRHIAKLVRLRLNEEDIPMYREQISSILAYVEKLQEVDTKNVSELARGAGQENVTREDKAEDSLPSDRERILKLFPGRQGDLLRVQAVFNERTE